MMWLYVQTERFVYTVGFYDPRGSWISESDHTTRESAARRVNYLNGGRSMDLDMDSDRHGFSSVASTPSNVQD